MNVKDTQRSNNYAFLNSIMYFLMHFILIFLVKKYQSKISNLKIFSKIIKRYFNFLIFLFYIYIIKSLFYAKKILINEINIKTLT